MSAARSPLAPLPRQRSYYSPGGARLSTSRPPEAPILTLRSSERLGLVPHLAYDDMLGRRTGTGSRSPAIMRVRDDPRGARRKVPPIIDSVLRAGEGRLLRKLRRIT